MFRRRLRDILMTRWAPLKKDESPVMTPKRDLQAIMVQQHIAAVEKDFEPDFRPFYEAVRQYSGGSPERLYNIHQAVRYIVSAKIPGAFVECGVWMGGTMMMVAATLLAMGVTDRKLYLYDTYEGHPKPNEQLDIDLHGHSATIDWAQATEQGTKRWMDVSVDTVSENMARTGYPMENVILVKGKVEDTLPKQAPDSLALLRIDVDWYSPCKATMEHLYPRLSEHGVLILDDYGHYQGFRKAVDDYLDKSNSPILLNRVDYTCRTGIKCGGKSTHPFRESLILRPLSDPSSGR